MHPTDREHQQTIDQLKSYLDENADTINQLNTQIDRSKKTEREARKFLKQQTPQ